MMEARWTKGAAEAAGFDAGLERKLLAGIESGLIRDVHAVLINRGDKPVLEHYRAAPDESWGRSLGTVAFDAETLHACAR